MANEARRLRSDRTGTHGVLLSGDEEGLELLERGLGPSEACEIDAQRRVAPRRRDARAAKPGLEGAPCITGHVPLEGTEGAQRACSILGRGIERPP